MVCSVWRLVNAAAVLNVDAFRRVFVASVAAEINRSIASKTIFTTVFELSDVMQITKSILNRRQDNPPGHIRCLKLP